MIRNNKSLSWLQRNRSFFGGADLRDVNGKLWGRRTKVAPLSFADLSVITPENNPTVIQPTTALVHKIALGRSSSNAL